MLQVKLQMYTPWSLCLLLHQASMTMVYSCSHSTKETRVTSPGLKLILAGRATQRSRSSWSVFTYPLKRMSTLILPLLLRIKLIIPHSSPFNLHYANLIPLRNNSSTHYYKASIPLSSSSSNEEIPLTVNTAYNHLTSPKPATLPQEAANQGMYWQGDLLGGAVVSPSDTLTRDRVVVRVKWVRIPCLLWVYPKKSQPFHLFVDAPPRERLRISYQSVGLLLTQLVRRL